jgi:hypothetical protein
MNERRTHPSDDAMLTRAEVCKAAGISKTTLRRAGAPPYAGFASCSGPEFAGYS